MSLGLSLCICKMDTLPDMLGLWRINLNPCMELVLKMGNHSFWGKKEALRGMCTSRGRAQGATAVPGCSDPETASVQRRQTDRPGKPTATRGEHPATQPVPARTGNILNVWAGRASVVLAGSRSLYNHVPMTWG